MTCRAGDREDSRRGGDREERGPRRRLDVPRDPAGVETEPRQRHGGHEAERRRADADDGGPDEVRVPEARLRADAFTRGDREADEVGRLESERQRGAGAELEQPPWRAAGVHPGRANRHALAPRPEQEPSR